MKHAYPENGETISGPTLIAENYVVIGFGGDEFAARGRMTAYDVDTAWLAERLGFSRVVDNSIDTAGDRDFVASFLAAAALAMVHLSRLAEDVILFTSEEFGFFELADAVATGSSLMPQKKNPDPLELVRGKSGRAIGLLTGWLAAMKGTPRASVSNS